MRPLAARALLGLLAGVLAQIDVPAGMVLGPAGTRIHARVQAAGSWPERFAVLDEEFIGLLLWPALRARDAGALIKFLLDEETAVYGEGDRVDHAQLGWPGGGGIMLGSGEAGIVMELRDTGYGP